MVVFRWDLRWDFRLDLPGLVKVYKKLWKDPPCSSWVNPQTKSPFSIAMLNYQSVNI